jgi:soluble lytic murein transglycosylase-like protein
LNPYHNITVGVDYLAHLINLNGSLEWALMAYNGGPSYAYGMMESGELSWYATSVLTNSKNIIKL